MLRDLSSIAKERRSLGLSQRELARMAGVSQSLISKLERGQLIPNYEIALRIIRALEIVRERRGVSKVREVMNYPVISVSPKDNLGKAISLMIEHGISQLPVISGDRVLGSLTEESLVNRIGSISIETLVEDIMESPFPILPADASVSLAREILHSYPAVLIQENGGIVGIVTKSDILRNLERV
ncbi:MAG: CBS domain-containing protein [Candidatus Korarchaeum sp.]|nr:CBS domain-containing protein [Candidatus Korarchaeum sp.]